MARDTSDPHAGLTIALVRGRGAAGEIAPWRYEGTVARAAERGGESGAEIAVTAVIQADGAVEVTCADATLSERVRLLLRACYKQSVTEGLRAPPRKIVRWRDERV